MRSFLLIAQNCDGYEPIAEVTETEAEKCAHEDLRSRRLGSDNFYPDSYALWERGPRGRYRVARLIACI